MLLEGENGVKLCQDARHPGRSGPAFPPSQLRDRGGLVTGGCWLAGHSKRVPRPPGGRSVACGGVWNRRPGGFRASAPALLSSTQAGILSPERAEHPALKPDLRW